MLPMITSNKNISRTYVDGDNCERSNKYECQHYDLHFQHPNLNLFTIVISIVKGMFEKVEMFAFPFNLILYAFVEESQIERDNHHLITEMV